MVGVAAGVIFLMTFLCCRRYQRNKQHPDRIQTTRISQPRMRDNPWADDPFAYVNPRDSSTTVERQHRWEKRSSLSTTDEQAMGYAESGSSTHVFNIQRNDIENEVLYETGNPPFAGINPGLIVNYRSANPDDPFSDRHMYQPKPLSASYGRGPTAINHLSTTTPSQAYPPFPNWGHVSGTPSSPSVYPATLSVEENDEPDQLPTPTTIEYPKLTAAPSQSYNWGASAKKPSSYRVPIRREIYMSPPDSEDDHGSPSVIHQEPPSDGQRRSIPPPIPPKSPLRAAMSMRTILNVCFSRSLLIIRTQLDEFLDHDYRSVGARWNESYP